MRFTKKYISSFVSKEDIEAIKGEVLEAQKLLESKEGKGNDFLGWVNLPNCYDKDEVERIKKAAKRIQDSCDIFVVIGIGGSYLGARAAIEFIHGQLYNSKRKNTPDIYFVGNDISATHLRDLLGICKDKDVCINVISKSGTTTEPALAFRFFRNLLEEKYGEGAKDRIFATTDKVKGALRSQVELKGYESFVIDDDIGGRFSVLSAVGLLPIAVSGANVDEILEGARKTREEILTKEFDSNGCLKYAAIRNILYRQGKGVELLAVIDPSLTMLGEWWKQLFGESEGKDNKGIFPTTAVYSTDLHSIGQYIQEGERLMFETVINTNVNDQLLIPNDPSNADGLNFITGKEINFVNQNAFEGTVLAHTDGGVPNLVIEIKEKSAYEFGCLVYFFEYACAVSGYVLGVNPFNQPGVEAYKKNMFALLGKPGYEELKNKLEERISGLGL